MYLTLASINQTDPNDFRLIEASTGETPAALVRRLRIERAEQLLRARAGSVSEIAQMVGFRSRSHFTRAFQRLTGRAPTEVRGEASR